MMFNGIFNGINPYHLSPWRLGAFLFQAPLQLSGHILQASAAQGGAQWVAWMMPWAEWGNLLEDGDDIFLHQISYIKLLHGNKM